MYQIIQGDCIEGMKTLPDESVHCVVTSPPYYGLRDYGTATWEGGDADCDHVEMAIGMSEKNTLNYSKGLPPTNAANVGKVRQFKQTCAKCGAVRVDQQIGLEDTPEAYVERLVNVFREVRRILRHDGTVWLNLGDSYAGGNQTGRNDNGRTRIGRMNNWAEYDIRKTKIKRHDELKPKDLIGIPWRVAFALQADGWWLRQDIIWHKPNPMPESVTDRCTKSHEYIFLLTKSERYYYDAEAVKEESTYTWNSAKAFSAGGLRANKGLTSAGGAQFSGTKSHEDVYKTGRNKRSVWTVNPRPYKEAHFEAHFAVFPPKLIEPCVLAGSPTNGVVFDPFTGSGTTAEVALKFGRSFIGTELNPKYVELIHKRLSHMTVSMFTEGLM